MSRTLILTIVAVLALAATAVAAPKAGQYKGKVQYQGYDVSFSVKGNKVTKFRARMLQDCDRDGISEVFTVAADVSFPIKRNGRVNAKRSETISGVKATYVLEGRFTGRTFKGSIREWDFIDGVGITCDTLKRKFTAKR
jgi:hypothetical protein